jgi:hypothetical protein
VLRDRRFGVRQSDMTAVNETDEFDMSFLDREPADKGWRLETALVGRGQC